MLKIIRYTLLGIMLLLNTTIATLSVLVAPTTSISTEIFCRIIRLFFPKIMNLNIEIQGKENIPSKGPALLLANHQTNFDVFLSAIISPYGGISIGKKSLIYIPFFGLFYLLSGHILINRSNKRKAIHSMNMAHKKLLKKKRYLWIFPEGTRSKDRPMGKFKKGAFHIASKGNIPIVPIVYEKYAHNFDLNKWNMGKIIIKIHPPITPNNRNYQELLEETENIMRKSFKQISSRQ